MTKTVVMIGLHPKAVDYSDPAYANFPELNADVLATALEKDRQALVAKGYEAVWSLSDKSEGAQEKFIEDLLKYKPDAVMIGAGVRFNPALTTLFEILVNLVRYHAPQARLCFNSGPFDTADAVERQT